MCARNCGTTEFLSQQSLFVQEQRTPGVSRRFDLSLTQDSVGQEAAHKRGGDEDPGGPTATGNDDHGG
jgi:hypothetical protein